MSTNEIDDFLDFFNAAVDKSNSKTLEDKIYAYYSGTLQKTAGNEGPAPKVRKNLTFDRGWYYAQKYDTLFQSTGKYLLTKGGDCVSVAPNEFIEDNDLSNGYGQDGKCYVKLQVYQFSTLGSWNWVCGQNYFGSFNTLRLYFSFINEEKALALKFIKHLKEIFDQKGIPFRIKFENKLSERNENAVLYFQRSDYFPVFAIMAAIYSDFSRIFRNSAMPFVKKFSEYPGVFFAESPTSTTSSFGTSLSRVLVKILLGKDRANSDEFIKGLKKEGLVHDKLYLNPNTNFPYSFEPLESKPNASFNFILDYDMLRFDANMVVASKIINIIIRNLYVTSGVAPKTQFRIFEGTRQDEEVVFVFAPDIALKEVAENLTRFSYLLNKLYNASDDYVKIFMPHLFKFLPEENFQDAKACFDIQLITGGDFDNPNVLDVLAKSDILDKESEELIDKIRINLEERGVVSYLPDDEFVCSHENKGYNYILKNLLIKIGQHLK